MLKRRLMKWSVLLTSTTFAGLALPGCDAVTGIIDQLLGLVGVA